MGDDGLEDMAPAAVVVDASRAEASDAQGMADVAAEIDLLEPMDGGSDQVDVSLLDMTVDMTTATSRCRQKQDGIVCSKQNSPIAIPFGVDVRSVYWQSPTGPAPAGGWPAVVYFQGSGMPASQLWEGRPGGRFGAFYLLQTVAALLDEGFVVIAPEARYRGTTYWDTNIPPWRFSWRTSGDHRLMEVLFERMARGNYGTLDPQRLYAMGISSGGYMTSRMALSYPGKFRALAIASASWATCGGSVCSVPDVLPADHPPTLFLHGTDDAIVPLSTMEPYALGLEAQGVPTRRVVAKGWGHEWLPQATDEVVRWFTGAGQ